MVFGPLGSTAQTATMALKPLTYEDLLFQLLRDANIKKFNARKSANPNGPARRLRFCHLDVRGLHGAGIDFSTAIFAAPTCAASTFPKPRSPAPASTARTTPARYFPPTSPPK
jgi:hypothetical protein